MSSATLQVRRDTSADWATNNPVLAEGEPAFEVDGSGNLVGAKVGNGTDTWSNLPYQLGTQSDGWAYYSDTATAQSFATDTRAQLTNNAGTVIDSQKPADITSFWTSDAVTGVDGDDRVVRVQFDATPTDGVASTMTIELDIGGAIGVVDQRTVLITSGQNVAQKISEQFELFCGSTFEANSCSIYLTFDGPVDVDEKTILVKRGHQAR